MATNVTNLEGSRDSKKGKVLIFSLDGSFYGTPLSSVKEIIGIQEEIRPIPQSPEYFKGLINLRGKVVSVIDLRKKLSLKASEYVSKKTSIVIFDLHDSVIGCVVDSVDEVVAIEESAIERNLDIAGGVDKRYVQGVAKLKSYNLVVLLDIAKTLSNADVILLKEAA